LQPVRPGQHFFFGAREGRPIGFLMRENEGKLTWPSEELSSWIGSELKTKMVEEAIRDELTRPQAKVPFPSLSVAICTRNRVATLNRCLDSVLPLQQKYGFELLVIDNAPPDDATAKLVKKFSQVRYILEQRPGLDFARNRAAAKATGDVIAYLDDDVIVDSGWLAGLQEAWGENSDVRKKLQGRSCKPMRYRLSEIEVTRPFRLPDENGTTLLLRRNERPIGCNRHTGALW
jgi:Glycosyl transferase family 2